MMAKMEQVELEHGTPPMFHELKTSRIKPSRHPAQRAVLEAIRLEPSQSYLLCGISGAGKSFLARALYRFAVVSGRRVVWTTLNELLSQYRRFEFGDDEIPVRPDVMPDELKQAKHKYSIFLEDIGFTNPTMYGARTLWALLDSIKTYGHQLVITANKTPNELRADWDKVDASFGAPILRRMSQCHVKRFQ
jgi:DNA replication protein DnaC